MRALVRQPSPFAPLFIASPLVIELNVPEVTAPAWVSDNLDQYWLVDHWTYDVVLGFAHLVDPKVLFTNHKFNPVLVQVNGSQNTTYRFLFPRPLRGAGCDLTNGLRDSSSDARHKGDWSRLDRRSDIELIKRFARRR